MKKLMIFSLMLIASNLYSQNQIKGKVKNPAGIGIANARVTLFNSDTTKFNEKRTTSAGKYSISNVPSGNYTLGVAAIGKDYEEIPVTVSGNISGLNFTLDDEAQQGSWNVIINSPEALGGTNLGVLLPDGKIFFCHNTQDPFMFDPSVNDTILVAGDQFVQGCVGPVLLPDGKIIFAGGTLQDVYGPGTKKVKTYDPATATWEVLPNMLDYRWYPTITKLPDNKLLLAGGGGLNNPIRVNTSEIYNPSAGTSQWVDNIAIGNEVSPVVLLYNGKVLMTHRPPQLFDHTTNQWSLAADFVQGNRMPNGDHSDHELVLMPNGEAIAMGYKSFVANQYGTFIERYNPTLNQWSLGTSTLPIRSRAKTILLPDKKILVLCGYKEDSNDATPTNQYGYMNLCDEYNPATDTWRRLDNLNYQREYHCNAILVPDGRVIAVGGEGAPGNEPTFSVIEAFTPPYLLRGVRPQINNLTTTEYSRGESINFKIAKTKNPTSVILMSNALVTHFMNSGNNRYIELPFTKTGIKINATLPSDSVTLPDGYYMLFVMIDDIPSKGRIIKIQDSQLKIQNDLASFATDLTVFPNPVSDILELSFNNIKVTKGNVVIEDILGHRVRVIDFAEDSSPFIIPVQNLTSGIYILKMSEGENIYTGKFIKN